MNMKKLPLLETKTIGRDLRYCESTGSTNRDCEKLASEGASEGVVVVAETQTAGRGRQTREWFSPKGVNLYFSLLLRPEVELSRAASLPLVAGLAVAEAIESVCPELAPRIKWPNDILIARRKICGILCEMQAESARVLSIITGIGINVNLRTESLPDELRPRATSLCMETGRCFDRADVLATILNRFEPLYTRWQSEGLAPLLPGIRERDLLCGTTVGIDRLGDIVTGIAAGIQEDGALRLQTADGIIPVYSGEAHLRPVPESGPHYFNCVQSSAQ
ncbi:MAG: biotin--[acetyl-CoA-carboxylase] ligase [Kiritimatiellae bacterium]|nr:biotin--[acetyl-CoA-carboxylase] ligase [Kiritimatiellia bacterium]